MVGILQPGYLPWVGFFEQMLKSDVFVIYDDVQYDKHGWRNRNRIKGPNGPVWLTVPVRTTGLNWPRNDQVEIDPTQAKWAAKHLGTLRQHYARAPYFDVYFPPLSEVIARPWKRLLDLDLALIELLAGWLGIEYELVLSSSLAVSDPDPTGRLVHIISQLGGDVFYEGASGRNYLDLERFTRAGIRVEFQNYQPAPYQQQYEGFLPFLSAVDLLFNCGRDGKRLLAGLPSAAGSIPG
ncbi:MAG: WbqC family protein [Thermodesulfobacteriota bacterium]